MLTQDTVNYYFGHIEEIAKNEDPEVLLTELRIMADQMYDENLPAIEYYLRIVTSKKFIRNSTSPASIDDYHIYAHEEYWFYYDVYFHTIPWHERSKMTTSNYETEYRLHHMDDYSLGEKLKKIYEKDFLPEE